MWNVASLPGLGAGSGVVGHHSVGGGATRGALPKIPSGVGSQYEHRIAYKSVGPAVIRPHGCGPLVWLPLGRGSGTDACRLECDASGSGVHCDQWVEHAYREFRAHLWPRETEKDPGTAVGMYPRARISSTYSRRNPVCDPDRVASRLQWHRL